MKTIEERAILNLQYEKDFLGRNLSDNMVCRAYVAGATEQKAIDEEVRLKKCDDMTEEEYERVVAFSDWYNKNGKGTPTFSDAIEWARRDGQAERLSAESTSELVMIDKVSDLKEMPCLAELGDWHKCANYVLDEIGDISTMTKNEIVYAIVRKVFEYSKKEKL